MKQIQHMTFLRTAQINPRNGRPRSSLAIGLGALEYGGLMVRWSWAHLWATIHNKKPSAGCYKLNIDGSIKQGRSTAGGIIRDAAGDPLTVFWYKTNSPNINSAEFEALQLGIDIAKNLGLHLKDIEVETDSQFVVRAIKGDLLDPNLTYAARKLRNKIKQISHVHREQNLVADISAKMAHTRGDAVIEVYKLLPRDIKIQIFLDKMEIPNYRNKKGNLGAI
ncbi:hypothetical protein CASFOL_036996 [Castilleja foliolosa]|uniref:RNase H type-1 domain-containing protein n=1 Tax=Castilleja foliolosa TaxID=1961234 RepID=A0ABD3BQM2_9LAMI